MYQLFSRCAIDGWLNELGWPTDSAVTLARRVGRERREHPCECRAPGAVADHVDAIDVQFVDDAEQVAEQQREPVLVHPVGFVGGAEAAEVGRDRTVARGGEGLTPARLHRMRVRPAVDSGARRFRPRPKF